MRTTKQMLSMEGRGPVISGGCGHFGRAIAEWLSEQGCNLLLIDRAEGLAVDLENAEARGSVAPFIRERFGHADVLVNNACFVSDSRMTGWVVPFEEQSISKTAVYSK